MSKGKKHDHLTLEEIVQARVMHLNAILHGIVTGTIIGLVIFIATLWLVIKGGEVVGPHLALLGQFFWGYTVTISGSFIGLGYGFVTGFVIGYSMAALYNRILNWRKRN